MSTRQPEYLQLEAGESVPSVRDRLGFIRGKRVLLIWPEEGTALTRKLDLVLIQREAKRRVIQLALVTHDEQVMQHAHDLGISTFETIKASERARWQRGRTRVFIQRYHKPSDSPEPEDLMDAASRVRGKSGRFIKLRRIIERIVAILILAGTIFGVGYYVVPSATVTLQLAREEIAVNAIITADLNSTDVDIENGIIPATVLRATVETTGTIESTGTQDISDAVASGTVVFTNLTNEPVQIPPNTVLSTSASTPVLFKTLDEATVPPGTEGRVEVVVEAMQASSGDVGNVEAGMINTVIGPLENRVTVLNVTPTTGGENRALATVTPTDLDRLIAIVRGQLQSLAYQEMQVNLTDSQFIVIETITITEERTDWTNFSHDVGDITDNVTLNMRAVVEAVVLDDRLGRQITFARLSSAKPPRLVIQPESITYERGPVINVDADRRVTFEATGSGVTVAQIDPARLQSMLTGLSLDEARILIQQEALLAEGTEPNISITPENFRRMPMLPLRINIEVHEAAS